MQQSPTRSIDSADKLAQFLQDRGKGMRMSHIYQPVLIRALVDAGGTATIRQLAVELLKHDESEIRYYEDKLKKMPLPVLKRRGVISRDGDLVRLNVPPLSFENRRK